MCMPGWVNLNYSNVWLKCVFVSQDVRTFVTQARKGRSSSSSSSSRSSRLASSKYVSHLVLVLGKSNFSSEFEKIFLP